MPAASARAASMAVSAPVFTVMASKAVSLASAQPSSFKPAARIAVYEATRSAMRFSPAGPW